ncbi:hypothetical protein YASMINEVIRUS_1355 [Yasminevirus sp. GU-2018]|uniref:Uncharacterized protein n=1 Tax=Yasminevirus sp. GU-2018 TaxID=2420051 RepID=A0A5K0UB85_9VIRU|nr:hypothetical protein YASMINEVIRUS_1355 [Yasminevirus sp. GU-2018]
MSNYYDSDTFGSDQEFRMAYASHVYKTVQTLLFQFMFTFGCVCAVTFSQTVYNIVVQNLGSLLLMGIGGSLMTVFYMVSSAKKTETQLAVFTVFETMTICGITAFYGEEVVTLAVLATVGIVCGLGVYAFTTQVDHTGWFAPLTSALSCLLFMGLFNIFFGFKLFHTIELYLGTVIFFGYIVVDVQMFLTERSAKVAYVQPDLHIEASLNIYLDAINIFVRLLEIISTLKGEEKGRRNKKN